MSAGLKRGLGTFTRSIIAPGPVVREVVASTMSRLDWLPISVSEWLFWSFLMILYQLSYFQWDFMHNIYHFHQDFFMIGRIWLDQWGGPKSSCKVEIVSLSSSTLVLTYQMRKEDAILNTFNFFNFISSWFSLYSFIISLFIHALIIFFFKKKRFPIEFLSLDTLTWKALLPTCPPLTFFSPFSSYAFWLLDTAVRFAK